MDEQLEKIQTQLKHEWDVYRFSLEEFVIKKLSEIIYEIKRHKDKEHGGRY